MAGMQTLNAALDRLCASAGRRDAALAAGKGLAAEAADLRRRADAADAAATEAGREAGMADADIEATYAELAGAGVPRAKAEAFVAMRSEILASFAPEAAPATPTGSGTALEASHGDGGAATGPAPESAAPLPPEPLDAKEPSPPDAMEGIGHGTAGRATDFPEVARPAPESEATATVETPEGPDAAVEHPPGSPETTEAADAADSPQADGTAAPRKRIRDRSKAAREAAAAARAAKLAGTEEPASPGSPTPAWAGFADDVVAANGSAGAGEAPEAAARSETEPLLPLAMPEDTVRDPDGDRVQGGNPAPEAAVPDPVGEGAEAEAPDEAVAGGVGQGPVVDGTPGRPPQWWADRDIPDEEDDGQGRFEDEAREPDEAVDADAMGHGTADAVSEVAAEVEVPVDGATLVPASAEDVQAGSQVAAAPAAVQVPEPPAAVPDAVGPARPAAAPVPARPSGRSGRMGVGVAAIPSQAAVSPHVVVPPHLRAPEPEPVPEPAGEQVKEPEYEDPIPF